MHFMLNQRIYVILIFDKRKVSELHDKHSRHSQLNTDDLF